MTVKEKAAAMGVSINTYYKMVKAGKVKDEQQETSNSRKSTKNKGKVSTKKPASKSKAKAEEFQIEITPPKVVQKVKAFEVPEVKSESPKPSKKKTEKVAVLQDMKEKLGEIIPRAYNLGKQKDWEETITEIDCKQIDVNVTIPDVPKTCNEFQVKMYVLDLAKKAGYAVAKFGFTDKGYAFTLIGPIVTN